MFNLQKAQGAISEEHLSGWLFLNFRHRDSISDQILNIPADTHNTRPWVYLVTPDGPVRLVHAIEAKILDHLPGRKMMYASRQAFVEALKELAAAVGKQGGKTAAQFSAELPVLSFLDHGSVDLLRTCGFDLVSSSSLIQRFLGVLDAAGLESHEHAARHLYSIVQEVWERIRDRFTGDSSLAGAERLREGEVQGWMLELFRRYQMETESPPLVAVGRNTADPHYEPRDGGAPLEPGQVIQFDLWAKAAGGVYADISWVGFLGRTPGREVVQAFEALKTARQTAVRFIESGLLARSPIRGRDVDREVRAFLEGAGYGQALKHRTGHAIDAELHGYGVNLDTSEFPDSRRILEGSCFSIEPGIYLSEFGLRTEINAYVREGRLVVSGGVPQREILCIS